MSINKQVRSACTALLTCTQCVPIFFFYLVGSLIEGEQSKVYASEMELSKYNWLYTVQLSFLPGEITLSTQLIKPNVRFRKAAEFKSHQQICP